jgi:hypothetical protein
MKTTKTTPTPRQVAPHNISMGSEQHGAHWFVFCAICGIGLVNKHCVGEPEKLFVGHDGRPDLDDQPAEPGTEGHPIPLEYCCGSLGWVPPNVKFDHQWDDTAGWDDE